MQREKLYNLQCKAFLNCAFFVVKKSKILKGLFLSLRKHHLLVTQSFAHYKNQRYIHKINRSL